MSKLDILLYTFIVAESAILLVRCQIDWYKRHHGSDLIWSVVTAWIMTLGIYLLARGRV